MLWNRRIQAIWICQLSLHYWVRIRMHSPIWWLASRLRWLFRWAQLRVSAHSRQWSYWRTGCETELGIEQYIMTMVSYVCLCLAFAWLWLSRHKYHEVFSQTWKMGLICLLLWTYIHKKAITFRGAKDPLTSAPDPRYRLALPRSPWA